ncbi:MAG: asparagine synthase [Bacteroidales bacterium]|nr:asparagine synthase [Bacteroidales bacterium]
MKAHGKIDKDFCLSSYMAFRYTYNDCEYFEGLTHSNFVPIRDEEKVLIADANDIDKAIRAKVDGVLSRGKEVGIMLSGGMDSAIVASYLPKGTRAYTFCSESGVFDEDLERSKKYCEKLGLRQRLIDITFDDFKLLTPVVMKRKGGPVHSIEPQIYKAAMAAKEDGVDIMMIGDGADYVFGGMDKILSKDWGYEEFIKRYYALDPQRVLVNPKDMTEPFRPFRREDGCIDFLSFLDGMFVNESYSSYQNAFLSAGMPYMDPYDDMKMAEPLDLVRIRRGESKYLIRQLYKMRFPDFEIPEKIPMPRPVDVIFKDWDGPKRDEFRKDIDMNLLTGNQKWQLWCAELFLNIYDK